MTPKEAFQEAIDIAKHSNENLTLLGQCMIWVCLFPTIFIFTMLFVKSEQHPTKEEHARKSREHWLEMHKTIKALEVAQDSAIDSIKKTL